MPGAPDSWRHFMHKFWNSIRGITVTILGFLCYATLDSGTDLIKTVRGHIADVSGTPPHWLAVSNEPRIIKCLFLIILFGLILLLVMSWIEFASTHLWRWARLIKSTDQISKRIPGRLLRKDGKWELSETKINRMLKRKVGRPAEMKISIDRVDSPPDGHFKMVPRIARMVSIDQRTMLPVWLHAYFDGAPLQQISRMRECTKHDQVHVTGIISRADIHKYGENWTLNIDLHSCAIIN
jgi:hypothetical protein